MTVRFWQVACGSALAAFLPLAAAAQGIDVVGRWAGSADRCVAEFLLLERDGSYESRLDDEPRKGRWRLQRDRLTLVADDEPDSPIVMHILDHGPNRLVAFDESIEADRRLLRCRP